ncbi:MAG: ChaN family lipoprotein [Nitrospira sp.]|nr:ChaN family lipoprotein [Nitrospira sp.]
MLRHGFLILTLSACLLAPNLPPSWSADEAAPPTESQATPLKEWQIWEAQTGRLLGFEELMLGLADRDIIYLGEEHHNHWHIEAALKVLTALSRGRRPILALEMFAWDGQGALDRYVADKDQPRDRFLKESRWEHNWGGAFEDYEPLMAFARNHRLSVIALNPPRSLVRLVAKEGLAKALAEPGMAEWGMTEESFPEDPAYHEMIVTPLRQCHGGLTDQAYQRMYEASMFRDEGMAKTISGWLRRQVDPSQTDQRTDHQAGLQRGPQEGPIVSYTGGGHIQYQLPVPNRVLRRNGRVRQATIYLTAFEPQRADEIRTLMKEPVANYLWLTPLSAQGPPRRCR